MYYASILTSIAVPYAPKNISTVMHVLNYQFKDLHTTQSRCINTTQHLWIRVRIQVTRDAVWSKIHTSRTCRAGSAVGARGGSPRGGRAGSRCARTGRVPTRDGARPTGKPTAKPTGKAGAWQNGKAGCEATATHLVRATSGIRFE